MLILPPYHVSFYHVTLVVLPDFTKFHQITMAMHQPRMVLSQWYHAYSTSLPWFFLPCYSGSFTRFYQNFTKLQWQCTSLGWYFHRGTMLILPPYVYHGSFYHVTLVVLPNFTKMLPNYNGN